MAFEVDQWNECYMLPIARRLEARKGIICWNSGISTREMSFDWPRKWVAFGVDRRHSYVFQVEYDAGRFPAPTAGRMGLYFTEYGMQDALIALADTSGPGLWPGPYNPNDFWFNT